MGREVLVVDFMNCCDLPLSSSFVPTIPDDADFAVEVDAFDVIVARVHDAVADGVLADPEVRPCGRLPR